MSATAEASPVAVKNKKYGANRTRNELYEAGKALRVKCPRTSHGAWKPAPNRPDRDYAAFDAAIRSGKVKDEFEEES